MKKNNKNIRVLTPSGYRSFDGIRRLKKPVVLITTENHKIRVTYDHPFQVNGKEVITRNLKLGDFLETKNHKIEMVLDIIPDGEDWVYDLVNVDDGNVYYANDLLVHNCFHPPGKSVIDPELLERLKKQCHDPVLVTDDGAYKIYTMPKPTSFYVVGVDVGEGIGRTNTTAQILDVSDLRNIEQVAVYANNKISPYLFGTRLMGIMNDWGRPPVLIENNNYGQQVLDVLHNTHNYESIVSYRFEGMSKHYDNENRLGIHSHTNTRYKGLTNFRYWVDAIKAVKFHDLDTLIEIAEFVQLPNYTFSKKREEDRDDRVFGLVWGLFVLEPTLAKVYFNITETDDQGRPFNLIPFTDNSDLIKKSPIFSGTVNVYKKEEGTRVPLMFIPQGKEKDPTMDDEAKMLGNWLHRWEPKGVLSGYKQYNPEVIWKSDAVKEKKEIDDDSYRPIVLF